MQGQEGVTDMFAYDANAGNRWSDGHDAPLSSSIGRCGSKRITEEFMLGGLKSLRVSQFD